ncbi:hypothetical protein DFH08DRAFT_1085708 [Mycena albidolilacea]|uniref:Uncharacterized protein n=1 Tax=Mycena albidolilacea TaxID=1033008 RepID=A0AAD6ZGC0_9AGAR|nr:hypothetical protein DFH08DRAFT_1085708 [Mycena albidolilacea]
MAYHAFRGKVFFVLTLREVPDVAVRVPAKGLALGVLGTPIVCHGYDLQEALKLGNDARMALEDSGAYDDEEFKVEEAIEPASTDLPTILATLAKPAAGLTGLAKKMEDKRRRDRAKRKATTVASLNSITPPTPTPHILEKAAQSMPMNVSFTGGDFRATQQHWTGLAKPLEHPLLAHANDAEFLKTRMQFADWQGEQTHIILDRKQHIVGVLVAPPLPGQDWNAVVAVGTAAMREARDKMMFPAAACQHRRASGDGFPAESFGFSFDGRRQIVGNIKSSSARNAAAMEELLADPSVTRMATFPIHEQISHPLSPPHVLSSAQFQSLCYNIFAGYHETKQTLLHKNPHLHCTFARSPFTAVTANLGPVSVSPPHTDFANKADGMCLIGALGRFDPDKGGHLVLWDYDLIVRFPLGCSILIPSAAVTHFNMPIQAGEERFSLVQYAAGGLFRWVTNGFQTDRSWRTSATAKDLMNREEERKARCAGALKKFTIWKDVKVRNYSGKARLDVWLTEEIEDFSDYTEDESEGERRPTKKARRQGP